MPSKKPEGEPKPKRAPKTPKEKAFAREYLANGGFGAKAVIAAGYDVASPAIASSMANENLKKLNLSEMMEQVDGLRMKDLLIKLAEGLYSNRQVGATTMRNANEGTVDFVDVPDMAVRAKYLELAFRVGGHLISKAELSGPNGGPMIVAKVQFETGEEQAQS